MNDSDDARLQYDNSSYPPVEWDNGTHGIQNWLERTAWRTLKDTVWGREKEESFIPDLLEDPLLRQVYLIDLSLFVAAEKTSADAVSRMMSFAPDEQSYIYLATQVIDETRHYDMFCRRMADFGLTPEQRVRAVNNYTTPGMRKMFELIYEQVDKRDFFASSVAQNIILEGMAYPIYRYEMKYWSKIDPNLAKMVRGAFADEAHHVGFGEAVIKSCIQRGDKALKNRLQRLCDELSVLMIEMFEHVSHHYVGLYQECANERMDLMGDIEIFPGHRMKNVDEVTQVRLLLQEIQQEHKSRMARIGLN